MGSGHGRILDEERFAKSYARGSFCMKRWGRIKILNGLKTIVFLPTASVEGLREIGDEEYFDTALNVVKSRIKMIETSCKTLRKNKTHSIYLLVKDMNMKS